MLVMKKLCETVNAVAEIYDDCCRPPEETQAILDRCAEITLPYILKAANSKKKKKKQRYGVRSSKMVKNIRKALGGNRGQVRNVLTKNIQIYCSAFIRKNQGGKYDVIKIRSVRWR